MGGPYGSGPLRIGYAPQIQHNGFAAGAVNCSLNCFDARFKSRAKLNEILPDTVRIKFKEIF